MIKEFTLNGKVKVSFDLSDPDLAQRFREAVHGMKRKQGEYTAKIKNTSDVHKFFDISREHDAEMRALIDGVLGESVCNKLFGDMNVCALSCGSPVWVNLMMAVGNAIGLELGLSTPDTPKPARKRKGKKRRC